MSEKVLIVGSGGREHALGEVLAVSPSVDEVFFAPGNAGTAEVGKNVDIPANDLSNLSMFAYSSDINLTVIGPDEPLAYGIVDQFKAKGLPIFGPTRAAARLEWSKVYGVNFMKRHSIPHPRSEVFTSEYAALDYVKSHAPGSLVIKPDGLTAGKGVSLPGDYKEAKTELHDLMGKKKFGSACETVVIQEKLEGQELSVFVVSDGEHAVFLPSCRDYKKLRDGDFGPNTGGMGAFSPVDQATPELMASVQETIIKPTLEGMIEEGKPFMGCLYIGLMLTEDGPKVIEYNTRFGDPEFQVLALLVKDDWYDLLSRAAMGELTTSQVAVHDGVAVSTVLATNSYPDSYEPGLVIKGMDRAPSDVKVFHGGTKREGARVVTAGGRVLHLAARGESLTTAHGKIYQTVGSHAINFARMQYRSDIGTYNV